MDAIKAIKSELKPEGYGVIDFLNAEYVAKNLVPSENKTIEGIDFTIDRYIRDGHIIKDIKFTHEETEYFFTERVKAISLEEFKTYFKKAGVTLLQIFGNYHLNTFDPITSERLILIFH